MTPFDNPSNSHLSKASAIAAELSKTISAIRNNPTGQDADLIQAILSCSRIFIVGAGRSGLAGRFFAMRLMHLGLIAHIWGDCTTPRTAQNDLVLVLSASGETLTALAAVNRARATGAELFIISQRETSPIRELCRKGIVIPETKDAISKEAMPLGTHFELSCLIYLEGVVAELKTRTGTSEEDMQKLHSILE